MQFLTRIPIRVEPPPLGREVGLSLLWYPAVGLLLGLLLWACAVLSNALAAPLAASLILAVWVSSTGALHLDGLADTADAWVGGAGDRERTLAIMKDPHIGAVAVAAVVCLLLVKFGALSGLLGARGSRSWSDLHLASGCIVPPFLARALVPILFAHTPYVRAEGIGAELARQQSRASGGSVAACAVLVIVLVGGRRGLMAAAIAAAAYLLMRRAFMRRLGGITGDCTGAIIEVVETVALVALAAS